MKYINSLLLAVLLVALSACVTAPVDETTQSQRPKVSPEVMKKYDSALQLMQLGSLDAALKVFAGVSQMEDRLSGPYVNSGLIYLQQDKKEQARDAFEQAIQRNPNNATALTQLALLQREAYELDAAREHYQKAVQADPYHANAHRNLGILCDIYLRDYDCALQHYQAYQQLNGDDEDISNWLIDLKERM